MTQRNDLVSLGDMLDAARQARRIVREVDKTSFEADETLQLALTHLVQIIGEAARDVSAQARSTLPQIPWQPVMACGTALSTITVTSISTSFGTP